MDLKSIIAISGKPGLYKMIAQGKKNVVVESIETGQRLPAHVTHRLSALADISIYTEDGETALSEVFKKIITKENGGPCINHKEPKEKLRDYFKEILPNYDQERVYNSDLKKLFYWYNTLQQADLLKATENSKEEDKSEKSKKEDKSDSKDK